MCGSATLTIELSSTSRMVHRMTATAMSHLSAPSIYAWGCSATASIVAAPAMTKPTGTWLGDGTQCAAWPQRLFQAVVLAGSFEPTLTWGTLCKNRGPSARAPGMRDRIGARRGRYVVELTIAASLRGEGAFRLAEGNGRPCVCGIDDTVRGPRPSIRATGIHRAFAGRRASCRTRAPPDPRPACSA